MINKKYSFKDFTGQSFTDVPAKEFNSTEIVGSCFYQEASANATKLKKIEKHIFPKKMKGVTFRRCNLDNVHIPPGNTIDSGSCTHKKIKVQNDLEDWVLDNNLEPAEPVNKKQFQSLNISTDPKDIPKEFIREEEITKAEWVRDYNKIAPWFKETPQIIKKETNDMVSEMRLSVWNKKVSEGDYSHFDDKPKLIKTKVVKRKILARDDRDIPMRDDMGNPVFTGEEEVVIVKVKGKTTTYGIKGKGYIHREGQKPRPFLNQSITAKKFEEMRPKETI